MITDYLARMTCDHPGCPGEMKLLAVGEGVREEGARRLVVGALEQLALGLGWVLLDWPASRHLCPRCK